MYVFRGNTVFFVCYLSQAYNCKLCLSHAEGFWNVMIAFIEKENEAINSKLNAEIRKVRGIAICNRVVHRFNNRWRWCCGRFHFSEEH